MAKPLNILQACALPPKMGGDTISNGSLLRAFAGQGHRVRCAAPNTAEDVGLAAEHDARYPEMEIHRYIVPHYDNTPDVPPYVTPISWFRQRESEQLLPLLERLISQDRPDLLIGGHERYAPMLPDVARRHDLPYLQMIRGGPTWRLINGSLSPEVIAWWLGRYACADQLITISRFQERGLRRLGLERVKTIANFVDLDRFVPGPKDPALMQRYGLDADHIVVVQPGIVCLRKRPEDTIAAAELALQQDPRLRVCFLGMGPRLAELEEACRQKHLAERIRFLGWIDQSQMCAHVNLADIVVMPSEGEGFSRVYLEAQACGRVLIASDIPPAREVVEPGQNGLLFRQGNVPDLSAQFLLAARNPDLRRRIGQQARADVQKYSLTRAVSEYVAAIRNLLEKRGQVEAEASPI